MIYESQTPISKPHNHKHMNEILRELFEQGKIDENYVRSLLDSMRIELETYLYIVSKPEEECFFTQE